jgi:hypothetical protein
MSEAANALFQKYLDAKSDWQREAILRQIYLEAVQQFRFNEPLLNHTAELETLMCHLDEVTYGSITPAQIRRSQVFLFLPICIEWIDNSIARLERNPSPDILRLWSLVKGIISLLRVGPQGSHQFYACVRLSHWASKSLLKILHALVVGSDLEMYYSPAENEYVQTLAFPLSAQMSLADQLDSLDRNLDEIVHGKSRTPFT